MKTTRIFVTGANGFVGKALVKALSSKGCYSILAAVRKKSSSQDSNVQTVCVDDLGPDANYKDVINSSDVLIHTAARAHIIIDTSPDPLVEFRKVNVEGTLNLARQAAKAGVRRFIFISSIGVNGNKSSCPFTENSLPNPVEPYAISKLEAELGLRKLANETGMEVVILRPPLVYGPNAPGNFGRLVHLAAKGIPLPLGAVNNKRSLVAVENLVDLIITCIDHPSAANQTFLAGDGEDLSTTELLQRLSAAFRKPARLFSVPTLILEIGATLIGKRTIVQRLCGTLQVDISKARVLLGWVPPLSVDEALSNVAPNFHNKSFGKQEHSI